MAKCNYCSTTKIFGGVKDEEGNHYCNDRCHGNGVLLNLSHQIPPEILAEQIVEFHQSKCPHCGGGGPIDFQVSHTIWSAIFISSIKSNPTVCCRTCGVKRKIGAIFFTFFLGWWGIPWGIIMTPVQIIRNIFGLFSVPNPEKPSEELEKYVQIQLVAQTLQKQSQPAAG